MTTGASELERLLGLDNRDGTLAMNADIVLPRAHSLERARATARWLQTNVRPDERVGFVDTQDPTAVLNIISVLLSGRSLVMLPPGPDGPFDSVLARRSRCTLVLRGDGVLTVTGASDEDPRTHPAFGLDAPMSPEALVLFTSGTTSEPRGVRLSRRNLLTNLTAVRRVTGPWDAGDRLGLVLALTHSFGLSMMLLAVAQSCAVVTLGVGVPGRATAALAHETGVNVLAAVPYYLRLLNRRGLALGSPDFLPGLRALFVAGGGITDGELDALTYELSARTFLMYGLTEATARVAVRLRGDGAPSGSVGLPLPGTHVDIVGADGSVTPPDNVGRIRVSSPSLFIGILGAPARPPTDALVTTDLGRMDESGHLFVTGREAEMLNFRGTRVSLVEQEQRVNLLAGVHESRLVPMTTDEDAQCVLLVVPDRSADTGALRRAALAAVEPRGLLHGVTFVESLETTRSGKPVRRSLTELHVRPVRT